jgi:uncharacterized membrane protein YdjX (TVP38/TMEM64 family)
MDESKNYLKELLFNSSLRVKLSALFLLAMYVLPLLSNITVIALFAAYIDEIKYWEVSTLIILGVVLFFTSSFSLTSTTLLSVVCGYLYGWISLPILVILLSIGSLLGYFLANTFDKGTIMSWLKTNEVAYDFIQKLNQRVNLMVFVMRLTPVLPFTVTNILCSYLSVPLKNYLGMGFIGISIRTFAMVYTGTQISSIMNIDDDPVYKMQKIGFLILSFALFGVLYYLVMKQKDKVVNS